MKKSIICKKDKKIIKFNLKQKILQRKSNNIQAKKKKRKREKKENPRSKDRKKTEQICRKVFRPDDI